MAKGFEGIPRCGYWVPSSGELGEVAKQLWFSELREGSYCFSRSQIGKMNPRRGAVIDVIMTSEVS
jgi:hypothetical protein